MTPAYAPIGTLALLLFGSLAAAVLAFLWALTKWEQRRERRRRIMRRLEKT